MARLPVNYRTYIRSQKWRETARAARERAGHKCQLCGRTDERLEVHHNSYKRLGREKPDDLVCLCATCHRLHHVHQRHPFVFRWLMRFLS